jgi:hypothetical protein
LMNLWENNIFGKKKIAWNTSEKNAI